MRCVIQRVSQASVAVDGRVVGEIGRGLLLLLGVMRGDGEAHADIMAKKVAALRVFEDDAGKMNLSVRDVGGDALCVSQFTICADVRKGTRPSFTPAAEPAEAERLYEYFMKRLASEGVGRVERGVFGADMKVSLLNDGPVTIIFDTDGWHMP